MKRVFLALALTTAGVVSIGPASAKGGWQYYDPDCPITVGPYSMKFVGTQPKMSTERVCDALADKGPSVLVLETRDSGLIDMAWDIRVLRDEGDESTLVEGAEEFRLPVEKHKNGMVNFDVNFKNPGRFILRIEATGNDGAKHVGRHRFTAGLFEPAEIYAFYGLGVFALVAGGVAFILWRQGKLGFKVPDFSKPS